MDQPKPEHVVVLRVTEIANLAFRRAASVEEIIAALNAKEIETLETAYENSLSVAVSKILQLLCARHRFLGRQGRDAVLLRGRRRA